MKEVSSGPAPEREKIKVITPRGDIWRTVNLLVKERGDRAAVAAARRAAELLANGDVEGCAAWGRILVAIRDLQRTTPNSGERLN